MREWIHKIEVIVDKLIPWLLLMLLIILVLEFGFHDKVKEYRFYIEIIDYFIILVFLLDLIFKYIRIRNMIKFAKECWIDIIAIFPFFLVFRFFEGLLGLFGIGETTAQAQKVIHIGVGVEQELGETIKEGRIVAEDIAKASRAERFSRFLRPIARSIRFLKLEDKHIKKEAKKEVKEGEKFVKAAIFYEKPGISHHNLEHRKRSFYKEIKTGKKVR